MEKKAPNSAEQDAATLRHQHEAEAGVAGAIAGGAMGAVAGPPGAAVGAVIGGVVGAVLAAITDSEDKVKEAAERELDEDIGVTDGDLGAPNLKHPPAVRGVYSAASVGTAGAAGAEPAEGPIQTPES